jgi:hypothetical protein
MDDQTQSFIDEFESGFGTFDSLHALAFRHSEIPAGVLEYWVEKLKPLISDVNILLRQAGKETL